MKTQLTDFTAEEAAKLIDGMIETWEQIAPDLLRDDQGRINYKKTLTKSEVIDVVLDADYIEMYARDVSKDLYAKFQKLSSDDKVKMAQQAFIYERYGW